MIRGFLLFTLWDYIRLIFIPLIFQNRSADSIDFIFIFIIPRFKLDFIDHLPMLIIQVGLVFINGICCNACVGESDFLCARFTDIASASAGSLTAAGLGRNVVIVPLLLIFKNGAGSGINLSRLLKAFAFKVNVIDHDAMLSIQVALVSSDGICRNTCVGEGGIFSLLFADIRSF